MQVQPVQAVGLQDLGFSFGHLAHNIGHIAHDAEKYGHVALKDAKVAGHYATVAAPYISAIAGDKYGHYASEAGQFAENLPGMQLQNLGFHWSDLGKIAHTAENIGHEAYKDGKLAGHYVGQAAPVISAVAGKQYGNYATEVGQFADSLPGMQLQNLGFSWGHLGHDLGKMAHSAEHVGAEAYKDAKFAGHVAGMASPVIGMINPEAGAVAMTAGEIADHMPLQNLQDVDLQNLKHHHHFSWKKLGHGLSKAFHTAEHIGAEAYKDAKIAGHYAGQAAPVIAALAGDKYGKYAQTASQYADAMPLVNLNQQPANVYLI